MAEQQEAPQYPQQVDIDGRPLTGGLQTTINEKSLEIGMSPEMHGIRFETLAIRKDFGFDLYGSTEAPGEILALGEHLVTIPPPTSGDDVTYILLPYRIYRNANDFAVIETYQNGDWVNTVTSAEKIDPNTRFLSTVSIQGGLAVADGANPIMVWTFDAAVNPIQQPFAGAPLNLYLDSDEVTLTNSTSSPIDYVITYNIALSVTVTEDAWVTVQATVNGNPVPGVTKEYKVRSVAPVTLTGEKLTVTDQLNVGDKVGIIISGIRYYSNPSTKVSHPLYLSQSIPGQVLAWDYASESQSFSNLNGIVGLNPIMDPNGPSGPYIFFKFIPEILSIQDKIELKVFITESPGGVEYGPLYTKEVNLSDSNVPIEDILKVDGISWVDGKTWRFVVRAYYGDRDNDEIKIDPTTSDFYWYGGTLTSLVTPTVLDYEPVASQNQEFKQITGANFGTTKVPEDAPVAKFLGSFGDRLFALWDQGDRQVFAASNDGDYLMWDVQQGAFYTALVDSRIDPVDPLMWLKPVSSQIAILARSRSLMRVFETGNPLAPVGVTHWMDGVGSEFPYGVAQVHAGLMFLGADRMVYYLTADQLIPVGEPIQDELVKILYRGFEMVDAAYDTALEEFILAVPELDSNVNRVWYILDLGVFIRTQEIQWRKRYVDCQRIEAITTIPAEFKP